MFECYVVWEGAVAVCERTEFEEPIIVYKRGTLFNLYQILLETELLFNYRAVGEDEFEPVSDTVCFNDLHGERKNKIYFNEHRFKPWDFPLQQKDVVLYAVEPEALVELLEKNPKAEKIFTEYAINQTRYLQSVRMQGNHIVDTKRKDVQWAHKRMKR